ncbi:MAG: membrane protein insertase YidC [Devosia sp.]
MTDNNRNMILAIALSVAVLFGWQFFVAGPQMERAQNQARIAAEQAAATDAGIAAPGAATTTTGGATSTTPGTAATTSPATAATFATRDAAISASSRVGIATASLKGSINLTGARIDDLQLTKYTETVAKDSPIITLLSPSGSPAGYYVEQGWVPASGSNVRVPDANSVWSVDGAATSLTETTPVTLAWDNGTGVTFKRTFAVDSGYLFTVTQSVTNAGTGDIALLPYSRVVREGTPHVSNFFVQHEGPLGVLGTNNLVSLKYADLVSEKQRDATSTGGWLGIGDKYWATAVIADPAAPISARFSYTKPSTTDVFQTSFVETTPLIAAPGATVEDLSYVFAGAKEEAAISNYEQTYHIDRLELLIDWGWFHFLTKPMFYLLRFLNGIIGNFGLAMLAMTVIVKALFFPLASRSYASMAAMRRVGPEMKSIQDRFKEDRAAQQQAMMELYKREKINPLAGCWPILVQIPVFFSLYTVLFISLEMRHAPFIGWIQDLAAPDPTNLFTLFGLIPWNPTAVPFIGGLLHLGVWPLIMGVTMWVQMRLNPPPPDPTQAAIFNWMPVIFTFTLGGFPAGLVIYWSWNNFLSILQQYFIMKRHGADVDLFGNILTSLGVRKAKPTAT